MSTPMEDQPGNVFTEDQVASLNAFQSCGMFHQFTCGNGCGATLVATTAGWTCPMQCGYGQNWAHKFMKDWTWKDELDVMHRILMGDK